jgi:hypothetical protein
VIPWSRGESMGCYLNGAMLVAAKVPSAFLKLHIAILKLLIVMVKLCIVVPNIVYCW